MTRNNVRLPKIYFTVVKMVFISTRIRTSQVYRLRRKSVHRLDAGPLPFCPASPPVATNSFFFFGLPQGREHHPEVAHSLLKRGTADG
jgi:hypothetical protein